MAKEKRFRPRRGRASTLRAKNILLARGELIVEVPDAGIGTGKVKMKMGDGTTRYNDLPYAITDPITAQESVITFNVSGTNDNATLLNEISSGRKLSALWGSTKKLLLNFSTTITELNNKYNSFESAKSTIINSALGSALGMNSTTTIATVASKISAVINRGAWSGSISTSGGNITVPAGYHNGSGKVTGPTLASLVGGNATLDNAANLLSGYTAYGRNGTKYSGTMSNRSNTIQSATTSTSDQNVSCFRINGTNVEIVPAKGYWGNWDWTKSCIRIVGSSLGVNASKILNDTTICGTKGTVAMKTSGSTSVTTSGKYGYDTSNGFWVYIPANAYYSTSHWINVPYAQASSLVSTSALTWSCPYFSSNAGINKSFPATIFSETPTRNCYIIAISVVKTVNYNIGLSVSGGTQKYRWQGKVSLNSDWECGCGTIVVQYVPANTKVTVTSATTTNISTEQIIAKVLI